MIDITPYQHKLTWLQEWISNCIDDRVSRLLWVNIDTISSYSHSLEDIMRMYEQTGVMFFNAKDIAESPRFAISFDQFCALKQQQEANIKYVTN